MPARTDRVFVVASVDRDDEGGWKPLKLVGGRLYNEQWEAEEEAKKLCRTYGDLFKAFHAKVEVESEVTPFNKLVDPR